MSRLKSDFLAVGGCAVRRVRVLIAAAGLLAAVLTAILGCPINVPLHETEQQFAEQRAAGAKAITAFSLTAPAATGAIDENAKTIAVIVPYGTDLTKLVVTFATTGTNVKVGSAVQVSGTTANDFTSPVIYTVTAEDSSTASYVVTVTVSSSSAKTITAFSFASLSATGVIDETAKFIRITVPRNASDGWHVFLTATFTTTGVSVKVGSTVQVSGYTLNDFSNWVTYTVTAQDGSTSSYVVEVDLGPLAITSFSFINPAATGEIDQNAHTISVTVPPGTDVTALVATFTTTGQRVTGGTAGQQASGVTANDFSLPLWFVVWWPEYAGPWYSNDSVSYLVKVKVEGAGNSDAKAITAFSLESPPATGTIDENFKVIRVTVPNGTDVTSLVATFITTGVGVYVGHMRQVSGVTANNFSDLGVGYTVAAEDGTYANYSVIVTTPSSARVTHFDAWIDYYNENYEGGIAGMPLSAHIYEDTKKIWMAQSPWWYNPIDIATSIVTSGVSVRVDSTEYPVSPLGYVGIPGYPFPGKLTVIAVDGTTVDYLVQDGY